MRERILKMSQEEVITTIKEMGVKELRALRKELNYSISNLANLKKEELQEALITKVLENIQPSWKKEIEEIEKKREAEASEETLSREEAILKSLTAKEIKILNAMRNNEYQDALTEGCTWTFTTIDNSGIEPNRARGVISSLVKKALVEVDGDSFQEESTISFTKIGASLFNSRISEGKECQWGGRKLLIEKEETKKETKKEEAKKEEASEVVALKEIIEALISEKKIPVMNMKKVRRILRGTEEVAGNHSKDGKFRWEWSKDRTEEIKSSLETLLKNK